MINKYELKRLLFDLYNNSIILFNDYYNGKEDYTEEDIIKIQDVLNRLKDNINDIESEID